MVHMFFLVLADLATDPYSIAKDEFGKLLDEGIIRLSYSPWSSVQHMVKKTNGEWRPCRNRRALNNITIPDHLPLPHIQDFAQINVTQPFIPRSA